MNLQMIRDLIMTYGVSGHEEEVKAYWKNLVAPMADRIDAPEEYNVYAHAGTKNTGPLVYLSAHADEIGFVVTGYTAEGFVLFAPVDTNIFDITTLRAKKVRINTAKGEVLGVIGHAPSHCLPWDPYGKKPEWTDLWIDLGAQSRREAESLVAIGDPIAMERSFDVLNNRYICSGALDNRVSCAVVAEVFQEVAKEMKHIRYTTGIHIQEEVDQRGGQMAAQYLYPDLNIVVDTMFALDHPHVDNRTIGETSLDGGPILIRNGALSSHYTQALIDTATQEKIPHQVIAWGAKLPTDTFHMSKVHHGVPTILVTIPLRHMHTTVEMVSLEVMEQTKALLCAFLRNLDQQTIRTLDILR